MAETSNRRRGDRRDGKLIRDIEPIQYFTGIIYPNRCDNEAFFTKTIDLTRLNEFVQKKNEELQAKTDKTASDQGEYFKYTLFHVLVTALMRTISLRPKMNRFVANNDFYQRNDITAAFIVKKKFADNGGEGLAFVKAESDDNVDTIHEKIRKIVYAERKQTVTDGNQTEHAMELFMKLPRGFRKWIVRRIMWIEKHGWAPDSLIGDDPYQASFVVSNVGSIGLEDGYHHLTNWGTTSVFMLIPKITKRPVYNEDGSYVMHDMVDLKFTIDERLADGYYYAKSLALLAHLLQNPELLEEPMSKEVEYQWKR